MSVSLRLRSPELNQSWHSPECQFFHPDKPHIPVLGDPAFMWHFPHMISEAIWYPKQVGLAIPPTPTIKHAQCDITERNPKTRHISKLLPRCSCLTNNSQSVRQRKYTFIYCSQLWQVARVVLHPPVDQVQVCLVHHTSCLMPHSGAQTEWTPRNWGMSFPWWKVPEGQAERKVSPSAQNWSTYLSPHSIGQNLLLVPCYLQDKVQSLRLSSILYRNQIDYNRKAFFRCSAAQERASLSSSLAFLWLCLQFSNGSIILFHTNRTLRMQSSQPPTQNAFSQSALGEFLISMSQFTCLLFCKAPQPNQN